MFALSSFTHHAFTHHAFHSIVVEYINVCKNNQQCENIPQNI